MIITKKVEVDVRTLLNNFAYDELAERFTNCEVLLDEFQQGEVDSSDMEDLFFSILSYGYKNKFKTNKQYEKEYAKANLISPMKSKCLSWNGKLLLRQLLKTGMYVSHIAQIFNLNRHTIDFEITKGLIDEEQPKTDYNPELSEYREFCKVLERLDISKEKALEYFTERFEE